MNKSALPPFKLRKASDLQIVVDDVFPFSAGLLQRLQVIRKRVREGNHDKRFPLLLLLPKRLLSFFEKLFSFADEMQRSE